MRRINYLNLAAVFGVSTMLLWSGCSSDSNNSDTPPATSIEYIDYKGETRTAAVTAGDAEYHTGAGFGKTMFDSADKKCQHCHNELYDTWKSSMHGKSWTDPVFQSKFQDFLRIQLAKIGSNPTGALVYEEKHFKGAAQTCIKCHAPGAYYAGDVAVGLTTMQDTPTTADLAFAKENNQSNTMDIDGTFDPSQPTKVVSASGFTGILYQASFQIGHAANQEGINCAFCHSIETVRMMNLNGADGGQYLLKDALREGPVGTIKYAAGTTLAYSEDATDPDMNGFFRLWGPEKYNDTNATPKTAGFDTGKFKDGRYTMHSVDLNGTNGKVHYTGGPFYGPFGVTGKANENSDDETNRTAHINPLFADASDNDNDNHHFGQMGKALCLSCHQRSAGALDPASDGVSGKSADDNFMELCSTWNAVTAGADTNHNDTDTSPKCQKCHMERIEGKVLHRWAAPDQNWTLANNPSLTAHFDPADTENLGDENPVASGWLNSHAFLGASKTGQKASVTAKIQSGFNATLEATSDGSTLTVNTTLQNLTAHMFPGAHPMRRVLTRVVVTDDTNATIAAATSVGASTFADIVNNVQTLSGKTLHSSAQSQVAVNDGGRMADFPGKTPDLNGSAVSSQKFDGTKIWIAASDSTVKDQQINAATYAVEGNATNAAITDSGSAEMFTRIYGHETGKIYNGTFVVRPGFDSNTVPKDNRLAPNETETYTLTYDVSGKTGVSVTYKVYYMQKGANGSFPATPDGWLNETLNAEKKLLITEVYSETVTP